MKGLIVKNTEVVLEDRLNVPLCSKNEVLIKVICASVNPTDLDFINGEYDFFLKVVGGNHLVKTGLEFSGIIEKEGRRFKKGDKVFGYVDLIKGIKAHQEYITINEDYIASMPADLSFEQAASLPLGSLTTLVALKDLGQIFTGAEVLINGASGGLGVYAVQIAKIFDGKVTAIAGSGQEDFLKKLGAYIVIDYNNQGIKDLSQKFDILLDLTAKLRFKEIQHLLSKNGKFIPTDPLKNVMDFFIHFFSSKKTKYLFVDKGNYEKLTQITQWSQEGRLETFVDSIYSLSDYKAAFKRLESKGKRGRIIMKIGTE